MLRQDRARPAPAGLSAETRGLVVILLFGAVLPLLDATIINVALDRLSATFAVPVSTIQWTVTGYAIAGAVAIPVSGWAVTRYGGKRVWLAALVLFLLGSVLSGLAWNVQTLIAFRVLQGVGGGTAMPVLQTLLIRSAGREQARRAMAAIGIPAVVAPVLGPVAGGLVLAHFDWRWVFLINVPVCAVAIVLACRGIAASDAEPGAALDVRGLLLVAPALAALVYGLSQAGDDGGLTAPRVVLPLVAGAAALALFAVRAWRGDEPRIVDVRMFARPSFAGTGVSLLLAGVYFYGALVLFPLYYLQVLGYSVTGAGLVLAAQGVGALAARSLIGRLTAAGARPIVLAGLVCTAVATLPFALWDPHGHGPLLVAALMVRGAGVGVVTVSVLGAAYHGMAKGEIPHASSLSRILTQLGGAVGTALVAAVLQWQLTAHAGSGPAGTRTAYAHTFWWLVGSVVIALLPALLLPGGTATRDRSAR